MRSKVSLFSVANHPLVSRFLTLFTSVIDVPLFVLLYFLNSLHIICFWFFSIFISRRSQLGGGTKTTACIPMTMPTAMHQVLAQSVHIAHAMAVFPHTCVRLRMWPKYLTAVLQPTGLRGKKGWWGYRPCWRTSVLSGTHAYMHRSLKDCSVCYFLWSCRYTKDEVYE